MIDLAILGLLTDQELHGYELKKQLAELWPSRASVSFGSLYPALARLEAQGAVKAVEQRTSVPAPPMSGSLTGELAAFRGRVRDTRRRTTGGRGKKVYGITDAGRERFIELLADPDVSDDRTFMLRVALARHLPPAERLDMFERRRAVLEERQADLAGRPARAAAARRPDAYITALLERDADNLANDLTWIDRLIDAERSAPTIQEEQQ